MRATSFHAMASISHHVTMDPFSQGALMYPLFFVEPLRIHQSWGGVGNLLAIPQSNTGFPKETFLEMVA